MAKRSYAFAPKRACDGHIPAVLRFQHLAVGAGALRCAVITSDNSRDNRYRSRKRPRTGLPIVSKQGHEASAGTISRAEVRDQLRRVLLSRHFVKAKKKSRFLEFMCEQALAGKAEEVNEYTIGAEIYQHGADFNPQEDSIVRVQAHEIRRSLMAYYDNEGREDGLKIDLPPGGYVPVFTRIDSNGTPALQEVPIPDSRASLLSRQAPYRWTLPIAILAAAAAGWLV